MSGRLERAAAVGLLLFSGVTFLAIAALAIVHVDDRYGVTAASGVWMGLTAAAHAGVWYPPDYSHGFYGGTRYMPLPILVELAGRIVGGEYLVSAKALIYAVNVGLYVLVFVIARRRGAPTYVALAIIATILASSAASTTFLGLRWDSLATVLQVLALGLVAERSTPRRTLFAGILCALAIMTKVSAIWGPAAITVWLARRTPRRLVEFVCSFVLSVGLLLTVFEALTGGRLLQQLRQFTFAGSSHSTLLDGLHRFYQLAMRNERSLPLLLLLAGMTVVVSCALRRLGPYELGLTFAVPILIVVMRDFGTYENHLIDLEVLSGLVVAGLWSWPERADWWRVGRLGVAACLVIAAAAAGRYTLVPDTRSAVTHTLRGRPDPRYSVNPAPQLVRMGTCALFEDASIPILAGQRPVVLDAFITHRLQTEGPHALALLVHRIDAGGFAAIALNFPLTNVGWFATLDFGTALADAMRSHYRLSGPPGKAGLYVYTPVRTAGSRARCQVASVDRWR